MTRRTIGATEKQPTPAFRRIGQRGFSGHEIIIRRIIALPFKIDEIPQSHCDFDDCHLIGGVDCIKGIHKHLSIFGNNAHAFGQDGPRGINAVVNSACNFVFFGVSRHFKLRNQGENCLGRDNGV